MTWPRITEITSQDPVSADVVNKPLAQLIQRTDYLRVILLNTVSGEFNYVADVPVSAASREGDALYWDVDNGRFSKTLAKWGEHLSPYGSLLPAPSTYLSGILVRKHTDETGALVISGYIRDFQHADRLFDTANPAAGLYYVSGDKAGTLSTVPPPMTVPAAKYDGEGGLLLMPGNAIVANHDHKQYLLDKTNWLVFSDSSFAGMNIPPGAAYGYDIENASDDIKELFNLYTGAGSFVLEESGTMLNDSYIQFNTDNIWILDTVSPIEDILAFVAYPNSHGPNIIRAVTTDTPNYLSFQIDDGLLNIHRKATETAVSEDESEWAIKSLADNVQTKGRVVTKIVAGPGIEAASTAGDGRGAIVVSMESEADKMHDADIINLNNAIQRTDGGLVYSVLPAARDSSITSVVNLSEWSGADRRLKIRAWVRGFSDGSHIPALSLNILVFPKPAPTGTSLPTEISSIIPVGSVSTEISKYYLCEADLGAMVTVTQASQIQYRLSPQAQPASDILILRQGVTVYTPAP